MRGVVEKIVAIARDVNEGTKQAIHQAIPPRESWRKLPSAYARTPHLPISPPPPPCPSTSPPQNTTDGGIVSHRQLNVYERPLVLVDADGHTREFYASKGVRLSDAVLPPPVTPPVYEPPLLPPTVDSFTGGDDNDDLVSRSTSLIPSPPRKIRGEDVMFRYTAELT